MQTIKQRIKTFIKVFVAYTIEEDTRIYRLRHTPFVIKTSLTKKALRTYGKLPVNPKKIVFDNYMGSGYGCNCKYVTEALIRRGTDFELVWMVKNAASRKEQFPKEVRLVEYGSPEALQEYYTAAVWVCNYHLIHYWNRGLVKRQGQSYIQMWHGSFGIKRIEKDCDSLTSSPSWTYLAKKNAENTDFWISNSAFENQVYEQAFWSVKNILQYGHPRSDIFFSDRRRKAIQKVAAFLQLQQGEQLLLYVPTFRENLEFPEYRLDAKELKDALEQKTKKRFRIAVRLHPKMRESMQKVCIDTENQISNVNDYPDIQELLAAAQVVITDYSSCIFDFLLTGGWGFLFTPDCSAYHRERGFYYPLEQTPFPIADTREELLEQIKNFNEEAYQLRVRAFLQEKGSVEDGKASERVCDLVERLLTEKGNKNEY